MNGMRNAGSAILARCPPQPHRLKGSLAGAQTEITVPPRKGSAKWQDLSFQDFWLPRADAQAQRPSYKSYSTRRAVCTS